MSLMRLPETRVPSSPAVDRHTCDAVVAAPLEAVVVDREAGGVGGENAAGGDASEIAALDPPATGAQPRAEAAGALDDAVGHRQIGDAGKIDETVIGAQGTIGAVEQQAGERDAPRASAEMSGPPPPSVNLVAPGTPTSLAPSGRRRPVVRHIPAGMT